MSLYTILVTYENLDNSTLLDYDIEKEELEVLKQNIAKCKKPEGCGKLEHIIVIKQKDTAQIIGV